MNNLEYYLQYQDYFWEWDVDSTIGQLCISMPHGDTIIYEEQLIETLRVLSKTGIPRLGTLLLLFIATSANGQQNIDKLYYQFLKLDNGLHGNNIVGDAIKFLRLVSKLPANLKRGSQRILVLQQLLEGSHNNYAIKKSISIFNSLGYFCKSQNHFPEKQPLSSSIFEKDVRPIALLLKKYPNAESIIAKLSNIQEINLEDFEQEIEQSNDNHTVDWHEELLSNPKTFHSAALIKSLWAGLHIPFQGDIPSQQPLGGVTDLSNKGNLERLLLSELAHEDIVLLSRLAHNEALYLQRELPPQNNPKKRVFLIDISIKNWGTPKTLAFSIWLSLLKHPKAKMSAESFVIGNDYTAISAENIESIIQGLDLLDYSLHAGNGIKKFFDTQSFKKSQQEIFYISNKASTAYPAIQKELSLVAPMINYWIYVTAEGKIEIHYQQNKGLKPVQELLLPLKSLWEKTPPISKQTTPQKRERNSNVYPILIPPQPQLARFTFKAKDGNTYFIVANALCKALDENKGWEVLLDRKEMAESYALGINMSNEVILLAFVLAQHSHKKLSIYNINTGYWGSTGLASFKWKNLFFDGNHFYMIQKNMKYTYVLENGESPQTGAIKIETSTVETNDFETTKKVNIQAKKSETKSSVNFLKNITEVGISKENKILLNRHSLSFDDNNRVTIQSSLSTTIHLTAQAIKNGIFEFPNGARIHTNSFGLCILENTAQNQFIYFPTVMEEPIAMSTKEDCCGNTSFLPNLPLKELEVKDFRKKYIDTFIQDIINHGTTT